MALSGHQFHSGTRSLQSATPKQFKTTATRNEKLAILKSLCLIFHAPAAMM